MSLNRATYILGGAVRWTVEMFGAPFRSASQKLSMRRIKGARAAGRRTAAIASRLTRMDDSLRSIERAIATVDWASSDAGRAPGKAGANRGFRQSGKPPGDIIEALASTDPVVRKFALGSVENGADEDVNLLIIEALHDPEPTVRSAAAAAAARADITAAVFSLILLLDDSSPEVEKAAKSAIERITGRSVVIGPRTSAKDKKLRIEELKTWWRERRFVKLSEGIGQKAAES